MTLDELEATLSDDAPPDGLPTAVRALWHDARGDWSEAHRVAQDVEGADGAWVHAYLHRKEGDLGNAAYERSRRSRCTWASSQVTFRRGRSRWGRRRPRPCA
jgi:hypothetical protein